MNHPQDVAPAATQDIRGRSYMLFILATIYAFSTLDRSILTILAQHVKEDLHLTDAQLGILGGIAFALLYAVMGIPAARLAERYSRLTVISVALAMWSAATVACGMANNFFQMLLARAGVGIGEAACTPCAHAMIADGYPSERRALAMSFYSLAVPVGAVLGMIVGAVVADLYGWRWAFIAAGAPGLLLAIIARFTVREPPRGQFDPPTKDETPPYSDVVRHLWARPSFLHMVAAISLATIASHGVGAFLPPLLLRGPFGLSLNEVALIMAVVTVIPILIGILSGGVISNYAAKGDVGRNMIIPGIAALIGAPCVLFGFMQSSIVVMMLLWGVAVLCAMVYMGPCYASLHGMVTARMRASAVATLMLITSVVGIGLGPVIVGVVSDISAEQTYAGNFAAECVGQALQEGECRTASFIGLRTALAFMSIMYLWAGIHYLLASRTLKQDMLPQLAESTPGVSAAH